MEICRRRKTVEALIPLDAYNPVEYAAEEYLLTSLFLDTLQIPTHTAGIELSLVGRIKIALKIGV